MMHKFDRRHSVRHGLDRLGVGSDRFRAEDGAIRLGIVALDDGPNARYVLLAGGAQLAVENQRCRRSFLAVRSRSRRATARERRSKAFQRTPPDRPDKVDFIIGDVRAR